MEKLESLCTIGGNINSTATTENSIKFPQKLKNRITIASRNPTSGYISNVIENYLKEMFALPCSLQHYTQQPRGRNNLNVHPSMDEW